MYDPFETAGSRFSYLASTTYNRMYHAVSGLMLDGHVLSGGCNDPPWCDVSGNVLEKLTLPYRSTSLSLTAVTVSITCCFHSARNCPGEGSGAGRPGSPGFLIGVYRW